MQRTFEGSPLIFAHYSTVGSTIASVGEIVGQLFKAFNDALIVAYNERIADATERPVSGHGVCEASAFPTVE